MNKEHEEAVEVLRNTMKMLTDHDKYGIDYYGIRTHSKYLTCETCFSPQSQKRIVKALDLAIYDMQNIEMLEEKIVYLENNIGVLKINIENLKNVERALNHDIDVKFKYIEELREDKRWTDTNDRLPIETKNNKYQEYYVTIKNNLTGSIYVDEAYYIDKEWKSTMEEYDCEIKSFEDVIAWKVKHIPEPYTKGVK